MSTRLDFNDIGIRKSEFVTKTIFLCTNKSKYKLDNLISYNSSFLITFIKDLLDSIKGL